MGDYADELMDNYDELRKSRDWSWDTMADSVETTDPGLAAEMRKKAAGKSRAAKSDEGDGGDDKPPADDKPKARRAPRKTAAASK